VQFLVDERSVDVSPLWRCGWTSQDDATRTRHEAVAGVLQPTVSFKGQATLPAIDNDLFDIHSSNTLIDSTSSVCGIDPRELTQIKLLGRGGYGRVDLYKWRGTPVAVKELQISTVNEYGCSTKRDTAAAADAAKAAFKQEIKLMAELHHPHVVQFLGATSEDSEDGDRSRLVLEYMDDGNLADRFRKGAKPSLSRRLLWAIQVARGMAYLHGRTPHPLIHRDLKPENVMLKNGCAKVADFGICKTLPALGQHHHPMEAYDLTAILEHCDI
jgi:serine/threonine protein kinase